ncbi:MAG: hypothetical protein QM741_13550 [Rudaea sp.]|uniref:hypothetical protein n=1 Tax=Rudaea sp. TaxID=2136325 RepID=UPI0039E2C050
MSFSSSVSITALRIAASIGNGGGCGGCAAAPDEKTNHVHATIIRNRRITPLQLRLFTAKVSIAAKTDRMQKIAIGSQSLDAVPVQESHSATQIEQTQFPINRLPACDDHAAEFDLRPNGASHADIARAGVELLAPVP